MWSHFSSNYFFVYCQCLKSTNVSKKKDCRELVVTWFRRWKNRQIFWIQKPFTNSSELDCFFWGQLNFWITWLLLINERTPPINLIQFFIESTRALNSCSVSVNHSYVNVRTYLYSQSAEFGCGGLLCTVLYRWADQKHQKLHVEFSSDWLYPYIYIYIYGISIPPSKKTKTKQNKT